MHTKFAMFPVMYTFPRYAEHDNSSLCGIQLC